MSTQTIKIQGRDFTVPAPYGEGHVLSAVEAAVLNQTFAENIRNNVAGKMKAATEKGEAFSDDEALAYANSYAFGVRAVRTPSDPVESEFRKLARKFIEDTLRAKHGRTLKNVVETSGDEEADKAAREAWLDAAIEKVRTARPDLYDTAKQLVELRAGVGSSATDLDL